MTVLPTHGVGDLDTSTRTTPGRVAPLRLGAVGQQPAQHLVGGPAHGRDGGDAEPLVDLGPAGVVDPGHDVLDAERLAGDPRGDDVGVVAAADRGERVGSLDPRVLEHVSRSKPIAGDASRRRRPGRAGGTPSGLASMIATV